jgi:hypothetical protein
MDWEESESLGNSGRFLFPASTDSGTDQHFADDIAASVIEDHVGSHAAGHGNARIVADHTDNQ